MSQLYTKIFVVPFIKQNSELVCTTIKGSVRLANKHSCLSELVSSHCARKLAYMRRYNGYLHSG